MSLPAYLTLVIVSFFVIFLYAVNPQPGFLMAAVPGILVLLGVPLILNEMNRRHMDKININGFKLYKIKDLGRLDVGDPVRLQGTVEKVSLKWLNRPNFQINDGSGKIGLFMFWAPREVIKAGDMVEAAGSMRWNSLTKNKNIWGVKIRKINK